MQDQNKARFIDLYQNNITLNKVYYSTKKNTMTKILYKLLKSMIEKSVTLICCTYALGARL